MAPKQTKGLDAWVQRLGNLELPVLGGVVKELNDLTDGQDTSANQLADAILKDASLTSQVLRIANSVTYSPGSKSNVSTISRAVVQVGFSGVRAICISVMVIDSLLAKDSREEMLRTLARGFHAGVQARNLMANFDKQKKEEAFTTALMMHLGDMAFWSRGGKQADEASILLGQNPEKANEIAQRVLGTNLHSISVALARQWGLGNTLIEALTHPNTDNPVSRCAVLGDEISLVAELGWDSTEFGETLARVSQYTRCSITDVKETIHASADEAGEVAITFGAKQVCHLIPTSTGPTEHISFDRALRPDAQLQLDILRELSTMVADNTDINTIFQTVIEGMHRGVGLERVAILLINHKTKDLRTKYMLGDGTEDWREKFHFPAQREDDNVFSHAFFKHEILQVKGKKDPRYRQLITLDCKRFLTRGICLIAPIYASDRNIGIFYADRGDTEARVSDEQIDSFSYFSQQANSGLSKLVGGNRAPERTGS